MIITERPSLTAEELRASEHHRYPFLCWRAIAGGAIATMAIHLLLTALGMGVGLATFAPMKDGDGAAELSVGAAIIWTLCAWVALSFGGFIAGRFSRSLHSGFVHGVLVWSVTLIFSVLLLSMGTGVILGGALKVLGEGLGMGGKAVAAGVAGVAPEVLKRTGDQVSSYLTEATQAGVTNAMPQNATRAKREIGLALARVFNPTSETSAQENNALLLRALKEQGGMEDAQATQLVQEWTTSFKALQTDIAKEKARVEEDARLAAERAASNLSRAGIWAFFALLAGLLITAFSGRCGASGALKAMEVVHPDSTRLENRTAPVVTAP